MGIDRGITRGITRGRQSGDGRRRWPILVWIVAVITAVALFPGVTPVAAATQAATAGISGVVTGAGNPLEGARVTAINAATGAAVKSGSTDATGTFRICGLAPGGVKLRISKAGWLTSFAVGKPTLARATVFTLKGGQYLRVPGTLVLTAEAAIEGEVLGWMDPLEGATVSVLDADTGQVLKSITADIYYHIGGLAAGRIKVRASKAGWLTSYANGRYTSASADVFTLQAGQTLHQDWDPMVLYLDLTPEAVFEGSVMGINDDPAAGWDDPLPGVTVTVFDAATGQHLKSVSTDALGNYRIGGLSGGQYKIRASKAGWLTSFAVSHPALTTADVFALNAGSHLLLPGIVLYAEAVIQGQVLGEMDPLGHARVTVFDASTGTALKSVTCDGSGYYRLDGLAAGAIKVRATKSGWLPSFANGKATLAGADVFTLYPGQVLRQQWDPMVLYLDLAPKAAS